jgi:C_GCAxxG_C_C family probable redox protein
MKPVSEQIEEFLGRINARAEELVRSGRMLCAEAVLTVLDRDLGGGLPEGLAVRLTSGLPEGLGGAGCMCGALSGGLVALGLFLTPEGPTGRDRKRVRAAARELHDRFKQAAGSTCCRVLTREVRHDGRRLWGQCAGLTGLGAEMTARLILEKRPELIRGRPGDYIEEPVAGNDRFTINNLSPRRLVRWHRGGP